MSGDEDWLQIKSLLRVAPVVVLGEWHWESGMWLTISLTLGEFCCETTGLHALALDCRPRGDSKTSVAFLEVAAVERLLDLECLATGVDIVGDEIWGCELLWQICG